MAPDRASRSSSGPRDSNDSASNEDPAIEHIISTEPDNNFLARRSEQPQFTLRALLCGLLIGILIAFSNTYFGLQTGWISGMAMPSALIGFAYFKGLRTLMGRLGKAGWGFGEGFSEMENVLVQTVAGSVGTMPLGCGFVGVVPALEFLLLPSETPKAGFEDAEVMAAIAAAEKTGGLRLPLDKLVLWALGICFFGVVFAVPLRKEVIVREKLKFPSGTATALTIGVLHGGEKTGVEGEMEEQQARRRKSARNGEDEEAQAFIEGEREEPGHLGKDEDDKNKDWKKQIKILTTSFGISGAYSLISYFVPQLHNIPILGTYLGDTWLWTFNPSPAYVGQGIIMGPATTLHMFLGALLGWAVLSPVAKDHGWASGDVGDWSKGSKGWIVWVSLAIMLADALVSLGWLILRSTIWYARAYGPDLRKKLQDGTLKTQLHRFISTGSRGHASLSLTKSKSASADIDEEPDYDAPPEHQIGLKTALAGLVLSLIFCVFAVQYSFAGIITIPLTILALLLALPLSVMGARALGETDLNPVSGISKLTQLLFALVTPADSPNAVTINLLAGAISEAGAVQAGDLLQDLKTGHLLGASPKAQFYGQLIGSAVGAVVSAAVYKLYTRVYTIPSDMFQVPTGYVWIFTARLVTGQGLPPKVGVFAAGAAALWSLLTALRIYGGSKKAVWTPYVPGGIAVAVGMYNTPSFTLARTVGGLISWYWTGYRGRAETPVIVLASGLILGEGLLSIVNLGLASGGVPHL